MRYSLGWMKTEVFINVYVMVLHGLCRGLRDMVYAIRGPAAMQARYCIHNNLVPRALFPGLGGGAGKGHFRVDRQKRFKNGTCGGELFF